jgi:hypothetical protein
LESRQGVCAAGNYAIQRRLLQELTDFIFCQ